MVVPLSDPYDPERIKLSFELVRLRLLLPVLLLFDSIIAWWLS